jgi:hypothetical protein
VELQIDPSAGLPTNAEGFLTRYSMSEVAEDKAEVFSHMVTDYRAVEKRAACDGVVRAKVSRMREIVEAFCPQVDAAWWNEARRADLRP